MTKHKVNSVEGDLSEYVFDFGGVLALRNFTAETNGNRLIIKSAENANFTILEALVNEVEIDGVVYDSPAAAQEALQRLVFNPAVPVVITKEERELIQQFKNQKKKGLLNDAPIVLQPNTSTEYILPEDSSLFAVRVKSDCALKIGTVSQSGDLGTMDSSGTVQLGFIDNNNVWLTSDKEVEIIPIIYKY